jgi:hypothetical protein
MASVIASIMDVTPLAYGLIAVSASRPIDAEPFVGLLTGESPRVRHTAYEDWSTTHDLPGLQP